MSGLMDLTGKPVGTPLGAATSLVDRCTSLHAAISASPRCTIATRPARASSSIAA